MCAGPEMDVQEVTTVQWDLEQQI